MFTSRILSIAPHAMHPPMEGASARSFALAREFSRHGLGSAYLGRDFFMPEADCEVITLRKSASRAWPRETYALLTLLRRGHYGEVKHIDAAWERFADRAGGTSGFAVWFAHFVYALPWTIRRKPADALLVLDTHNSEWEWFDTYSSSSRNPLTKWLCQVSKRRAEILLRQMPAGSLLTHVSAKDSAAYEIFLPHLRHVVLPNAIDLPVRSKAPDYRETRRNLLFFGSLSGKMNQDALSYFAREFWPQLAPTARMIVMGSQPSPAVRALADRLGWEVRADVSEAEADAAFAMTHFVVLPFEYAAGSKHKFLNAAARGVPILSTPAGLYGQREVPGFVHVSNSPSEWAAWMKKVQEIPPVWLEERNAFFAQHSWSAVVGTFLRESLPEILAGRVR